MKYLYNTISYLAATVAILCFVHIGSLYPHIVLPVSAVVAIVFWLLFFITRGKPPKETSNNDCKESNSGDTKNIALKKLKQLIGKKRISKKSTKKVEHNSKKNQSTDKSNDAIYFSHNRGGISNYIKCGYYHGRIIVCCGGSFTLGGCLLHLVTHGQFFQQYLSLPPSFALLSSRESQKWNIK